MLQILRLQECLSKYERTDDGTTPQVMVILSLFFMFENLVLHNYDELCPSIDAEISFMFLQVDLAHLLAARDQELRTLSAEVIMGILDAYLSE